MRQTRRAEQAEEDGEYDGHPQALRREDMIGRRPDERPRDLFRQGWLPPERQRPFRAQGLVFQRQAVPACLSTISQCPFAPESVKPKNELSIAAATGGSCAHNPGNGAIGVVAGREGLIPTVAVFEADGYISRMSATAEALLEQFRRLPAPEQQELLQRLLRLASAAGTRSEKPFPTVKVSGGTITSEQAAESLDDE